MMRKILSLARLNAIQILRNPAEVVGVIVLPLALTMLFGSAFAAGQASDIRVLFVDEGASVYSAQVGELIDAEESLRIEGATRAEAEAEVASGDVGVAVLVPQGFADALEGGDATIEVMRNPDSQSGFAIVSVVQGIATRMSGNAAAARVISAVPVLNADFDDVYQTADAKWSPQPPVYAEASQVVASEVRGDSVTAEGATLSSIGFTVWFVLFMTFGSAGGILEEREQGTLRRLMVAPVSRATILSGKVVGTVVAAAVQALILVLVGAFGFGVPWGTDPIASSPPSTDRKSVV